MINDPSPNPSPRERRMARRLALAHLAHQAEVAREASLVCRYARAELARLEAELAQKKDQKGR